MVSNIDIILTWVDGNNPEWIEEYNKYCPKESRKDIDNNLVRYRDFGLLRYWFRGIEKFAPWVRKIHFVTNGQKPDWLDTDNPKLNFVKHSDYIPAEYLPVFSSHPIELMFNRIPGLADHFVYFNDDFYLTGPVGCDFFFMNDLPKDCGAFSIVNPENKVAAIAYNNLNMLNKHFSKKTYRGKPVSLRYSMKDNVKSLCLKPFPYISGFLDLHNAIAYRKSDFEAVWNAIPDTLLSTMKSKFRSMSDVSQWLFRYWRLAEGKFYPADIRKGVGVFDLLEDSNIGAKILSGKYREVVIHDNECDDFEYKMNDIKNAFEELLPEKSSFELYE